MIHTILILSHALAGVAALVFGCVVLRPPGSHRCIPFRIYQVSLLSMLVAVTAVVAYDWQLLSAGQRMTFLLLIVLAAYTVLRGMQARGALLRQPSGWRMRYVDHVGFTVISLFDGFAIVSAIDLGAPLLVVVIVGALGIIVGITAINEVKSRLNGAPRGPSAAVASHEVIDAEAER